MGIISCEKCYYKIFNCLTVTFRSVKASTMDRPVLWLRLKQCFVSLAVLGQCYALPLGEQTVLSPGYPRISHGKDIYALPIFDANATDRFEEIRINREGYQYGEPLLGNTSFFPTGVLGDAKVLSDKQLWFQDVQYITDNVNNIEWPQAARALAEVSPLKLSASIFLLRREGWWSAKS